MKTEDINQMHGWTTVTPTQHARLEGHVRGLEDRVHQNEQVANLKQEHDLQLEKRVAELETCKDPVGIPKPLADRVARLERELKELALIVPDEVVERLKASFKNQADEVNRIRRDLNAEVGFRQGNTCDQAKRLTKLELLHPTSHTHKS